ncbi:MULTISPECIES: dienelactone hydrolase family protein [unclassified Rhodococcus (in: high G+C Gram-positive bacteria)]|uniref:dienelactone hydrolase family protein n=1 Tax=unclassified Rhodococcus (in: high G+C Gram-positive bacteria) TaxID=192944 RepID=UPI0015815AE4|nr:dienelactone hydrolase family protein [Rhodococcus sp. W8901]
MTTGSTVRSRTVTVGDLTAHLAQPDGGSDTVMLLLPMINGVDAQVRDYAADIAAAGITALVWDPWHGPSLDDTPKERLFELMGQLDDEECLSEMGALLDYARGELGARRVGVIGWCLGGRFSLLLGARDRELANVVAYHPSIWDPAAANHALDTVALAPAIAAPVMVLHAGADTILSAGTFGALQSALQSRDSGATIVHAYPGAAHGFSARARQDDPVNKAAWDISWPQVLAFASASMAR